MTVVALALSCQGRLTLIAASVVVNVEEVTLESSVAFRGKVAIDATELACRALSTLLPTLPCTIVVGVGNRYWWTLGLLSGGRPGGRFPVAGAIGGGRGAGGRYPRDAAWADASV